MDWFHAKSRKKRKRKKDDFWSDYLRRNCQDNDKIVRKRKEPKYLSECFSGHVELQPQPRLGAGSECPPLDRSQYQSNVFNQIFGKKFEGKTVLASPPASSSQPETYHFCVK